MTFAISLKPGNIVFPCDPSENILTAVIQAGLPFVVSPCGGHGTCGKCRVKIISGNVAPPGEDETMRLGVHALAQGVRLACRTHPRGDLVVSLPVRSRSAIGRSLLEGEDGALSPAVTHSKAKTRKGCGIAIDLGTTTVTAQMIELTSGRILARHWLPNPQRRYGDDVMTRLTFAEQGGAVELKRLITESLNELIGRFTGAEKITEICIASNTVMHHLLLGLPAAQLGRAPYLPHTKQAINITANHLGLTAAPFAEVYLMPNIAGFIGGDHVAALLGTRLNQAKGNFLLLDIGTNTEVSLAVGGLIHSASCASGPAFEGATLEHGMAAATGAIEHIVIDHDLVQLAVIDDGLPLGICGSGIVDALFQLRRHNLIDRRGRLQSGAGIRSGPQGTEYVLVPRDQSATGEEIVITQADINKIQLAKAAIRAGIDILLANRNLEPDAIAQIIIAGRFGSYLDIKSAIGIGLLPLLPENRITQVGNAVIVGARLALLMGDEREALQQLASSVKHVDLAVFPQFKTIFADSLGIN